MPASAPARVPPSFVGTVADGPFFAPGVDMPAELDSMVGTGVQSLRVVVEWRVAQPYRSFAEVPPDQAARFRDEGGVPTDYSTIDALMAGAAQRRLSVLPIVMIAPNWAARHPGRDASPPSDFGAYARFVAALARRYGPNGSFWAERPELAARPVAHWQLWNEPHFEHFWSDRPWAGDYVRLVRTTRKALLAVDPKARVVLAGMANRSWEYLEEVYRKRARGLFDIVAIHPFTARVGGVPKILRLNRDVMRRFRDSRKPIWITELSWTSARGRTEWTFGNETTEKGQAAKLADAYRALAAQRRSLRLQRVYWYTWLSYDRDKVYPFDYAGLGRLDGGQVVRKPAFDAMRRTALRLQGCRAKEGRADRCAR